MEEKIFNWLNPQEPVFVEPNDLDEILYTFSELDMWPDGASVSPEQAVLCHAIIEKLKKVRLPEKFKM